MNIDSAVFYSRDIDVIVGFYKNFIGLELEYQQGDKYVSFLFENGVRLGIKRAIEKREIPGSQTIFIAVDDAKEVYKEMQNKNSNFYKPLSYLEGYGHNFAIYDPDKNKIEFIQRDL